MTAPTSAHLRVPIPAPRPSGQATAPAAGDPAVPGARFVPRALGGDLAGVDALARAFRPVFAGDVDAGLARGAAPLGGGLPVWTAGDPEQRRRLAALLLDGGTLAVRGEERSIRDAFARRGLWVRRTAGGFVLDGECGGLLGAPRPDAVLLYATAESAADPAGEQVALLADLRELPGDRATVLPGHRVAFRCCPLPAAAAVGEPAQGARLFLRTLQVSGSATSAMALGAADACLRIATRRVVRARGGVPPNARAIGETVGGAFLDLLACDCVTLVATRAVGHLPRETSLLSAAARSVVPTLVGDALHDLAALLGPQSLRLDAAEPLFARHTRRLNELAAGAFIGRAAVLPQLPFLAREVWPSGGPAPAAALYDPAGTPPPFTPDRVTLLAPADSVTAELATGVPGVPAELTTVLRGELARVRDHFAQVRSGDPATVTDPASLAMADRYLLVLAAAACLGCYRHLRAGGGAFLADPAWITGVLARIARRLGVTIPAGTPEDARRIEREAIGRVLTRRGFDLHATSLEA